MSKEPEASCPSIDKIIEELETIRRINDELRIWGQEQRDLRLEVENKLSDLTYEYEILERQHDASN